MTYNASGLAAVLAHASHITHPPTTPAKLAPVILECDAILFDLDGTLINSLPAVDRAWSAWALRHGLDPELILPQIHGRRSIDSLRLLAPHLDADEEDAWLREQEAMDTDGVTSLPGALEFVTALPENAWTIVTSGTIDVAIPRIRAAGLPIPKGAVYGNDVAQGKPHPDPFLLAASRLGARPERCVVFEDTVAGLRSGATAGSKTVGVRILPGEDLTFNSEVVISGYHETWIASEKDANPVVIFIGERKP